MLVGFGQVEQDAFLDQGHRFDQAHRGKRNTRTAGTLVFYRCDLPTVLYAPIHLGVVGRQEPLGLVTLLFDLAQEGSIRCHAEQGLFLIQGQVGVVGLFGLSGGVFAGQFFHQGFMLFFGLGFLGWVD
jgi:hypothetical protein